MNIIELQKVETAPNSHGVHVRKLYEVIQKCMFPLQYLLVR